MQGHVIDLEQLVANYPTHRHDAQLWEWLGRTVATFGFLEEVLRKAVFALTGTRRYETDELAKDAYKSWLGPIERALTAELGSLIPMFDKSVRDHPDCHVDDFEELIEDLTKAKELRNLLCHASWQTPNDEGKALPFFVRKKDKLANQTVMDADYLQQVQRGTAELSGVVVSVVTSMGWQFPGSNGHGKPVW